MLFFLFPQPIACVQKWNKNVSEKGCSYLFLPLPTSVVCFSTTHVVPNRLPLREDGPWKFSIPSSETQLLSMIAHSTNLFQTKQFRRISGMTRETAGSHSTEQKEPGTTALTWRGQFPFHKLQGPECSVVDQYAAQTWVKLKGREKGGESNLGIWLWIRNSMSEAIRKSWI